MGDTLDNQVQSYVCATRRTGGMVTTTMVLAAGEVTVKTHNKKLLHDKDGDKASAGPIKLTGYWAKSLFDRMCFVKRKTTTAAKIDPLCFVDLKEQYLLDIKVVVEMEKVPPELILLQSHHGRWRKWSKRVEVAVLNDK